MAARLGDAVSCAFNESISLRLEGPLEEGWLRAAWQSLLERHEALRSTFSPDDGRLCIAETGNVSFECEDLTSLAPAQQQKRVDAVLTNEVDTPFDLENGPLARARLLRLGPRQSWFIFTAHHIVCDGWSMAVALRDLALLYSARGNAQALLAPAQPFTGYVDWLAESAQAENHQRALRYWVERL